MNQTDGTCAALSGRLECECQPTPLHITGRLCPFQTHVRPTLFTDGHTPTPITFVLNSCDQASIHICAHKRALTDIQQNNRGSTDRSGALWTGRSQPQSGTLSHVSRVLVRVFGVCDSVCVCVCVCRACECITNGGYESHDSYHVEGSLEHHGSEKLSKACSAAHAAITQQCDQPKGAMD